MGFFSPDYYYEPFFFDKYEVLPDGDALKQEEILKYKTNEFFYYYNVWENFHYFGLPQGRGWMHEPEWLIDFLKSYESSYRKFQNWKLKKDNK